MTSPLPTGLDTSYPDTDDPSVKAHQQHHDALHAFYNSARLQALEGVRVARNDVSLSVGVEADRTLQTWNIVQYNGARASEMWNAEKADKTRVEILTTGLYDVSWGAPWSADVQGRLVAMRVQVNGGGWFVPNVEISGVNPATMKLTQRSQVLHLTAGDYLQWNAFTDAAGAVSIPAGYYINPFLQVLRVA